MEQVTRITFKAVCLNNDAPDRVVIGKQVIIKDSEEKQ